MCGYMTLQYPQLALDRVNTNAIDIHIYIYIYRIALEISSKTLWNIHKILIASNHIHAVVIEKDGRHNYMVIIAIF
jgi:hypothetical protein